jgi:hypothetical protein
MKNTLIYLVLLLRKEVVTLSTNIKNRINLFHIAFVFYLKPSNMKTIAYFILIILFTFLNSGNAQVIQQLRVVPVQPTTATPVRLEADLMFSYGTCTDKIVTQSITGFRLDANSLHCLGLLTVVCYDMDTFNFGLLPAGNYRFVYQVNEGFGGPPCTPGINPGPTDSIDFVVSPATGMEEAEDDSFALFPNPASDHVFIQLPDQPMDAELSILNFEGRLCKQLRLPGGKSRINLNDLAPGVYFIEMKGSTLRKKLVVGNP